MSDYILTHTKTKFYPLSPNMEDIKIEDIAHALSLMTRANGHFKHFYSVAQHSINCYKEAKARGYSKRIQLGCLLHDAGEAYISDLTRPVKKNLSQYFTIEEKLQRVIYEKYGLIDLTKEELSKISDIDDAILYYEFIELMGEKIFDKEPSITIVHDFSQRDFGKVKEEFLKVFRQLNNEYLEHSFVGIDGCKLGYVAVKILTDSFEIKVFETIEEAVLEYSDCNSILIDMPIGLPEGVDDLRPEKEARKVLSSRASCVFSVPCRQAVYENEYLVANKINRDILGKGLSKQSFAICKKIKEVDLFLHKHNEFKNVLLEAHPEICFAILNVIDGIATPIFDNKKTEIGIEKRLEILSRYYYKTKEISELLNTERVLKSMKDDIIDGLCLAITGLIGYENRYKTIPEKPVKDSKGILMQMVYAEV